jgi:hypothetical protein
VLFEIPGVNAQGNTFAYDITPDDQRFLMSRVYEGQDGEPAPSVILVNNFFEELKARLGS